MATRAGRIDRPAVVDQITGARNYENLFASLFVSGLTVENLTVNDDDARRGLNGHYIVEMLYRTGAIAHNKITDQWLPFTTIGTPTEYGETENIRAFSVFNGRNDQWKRADCDLFYANVNGAPLENYVRMKCDLIGNFDTAIRQNLDAIKQITLILTQGADEKTGLAKKIRLADVKRRRGESVVVIEKSVQDIGEISVLKTDAEYLVDKLQRDKRAEFEDLLHIVGVCTPIEKGERMITNEIATQNAETTAYINILINTFNQCAERQGAPERLRVYGDPVDVETGEQKHEQGGNENVGEILDGENDD